MLSGRWIAAVVVVSVAGPARSLQGQATSERPVFSWQDAGIAAGAIALLFTIDDPARRLFQRNRVDAFDALADVSRRFGEWPLYVGVPGVLLAAGGLSGNDKMVQAGVSTVRSVALTLAVVTTMKIGIGRSRPRCYCGPTRFEPVGGGSALPSGHTAVAFSLAASIAERTRSSGARAALYTLASLVAWSRVNNDDHWLSDVVAGALVGTASAKFAARRWGVGPTSRPEVNVGTNSASLGWALAF